MGDLVEWLGWRVESARTIAKKISKNKIERWHTTALRRDWQGAGHAARRNDNTNKQAATAHVNPCGRGRPPPHWSQLLRSFSTNELRGSADAWVALAQDRGEWNNFANIFIE